MGRYLDLVDAALLESPAESPAPKEVESHEENEFNEERPGWELGPADFEERAAIIEDGAGVPREWAEGFARLCSMPRPASVHRERWLCCLDDAGRFIDQWAHQAAALGWRTEDVFGVHPTRPEPRVDCAGLVWLLDGGTVAAISEDRAEIRLRSGARQTYYRRKHPTEAIAVWHLSEGTEQ